MASKSIERFRRALAEAGLPDTIVTLTASARTADEAAAALGCATGQIVKSLVFADERDAPLLVLAAGDGRVDEARVEVLHGTPVRLGDAAFVRAHAGYAIGGVPPFGHKVAIPTLIDRSLERWETVWAAAGTPETVCSLPREALARVTNGTVAAIA